LAFLISARAIPTYIERYGYAFSWRRLWNVSKVITSMGLSFLWRRPVVWGKPFMLMVEPTNVCNLKCPLCPSGNGEMTRTRGKMQIDDFRQLIDEVGENLILLMLWNQGEPFINHSFTDMVRYAHAKGIPTITSTNGHYIRTIDQARDVVDSGLDEIIISLDGVDQATYERYRVGGKLEHVLNCARLLSQAKVEAGSSKPLVNLQFIVFKHNEQDVAEAERIAYDVGADKFLVKTAQVYTSEEAEEFLPETEQYRRYAETDAKLAVKGQPVSGCKVLWYSSMVNWNGAVAPCCFDKNVDFKMGEAFAGGGSFDQAWQGSEYMDFRGRVLESRQDIDMCRNCSEGYKGMFSLVKEMVG
jgi:MoaA/NifB/PqqE/SkfB family radical SAM enzyme